MLCIHCGFKYSFGKNLAARKTHHDLPFWKIFMRVSLVHSIKSDWIFYDIVQIFIEITISFNSTNQNIFGSTTWSRQTNYFKQERIGAPSFATQFVHIMSETIIIFRKCSRQITRQKIGIVSIKFALPLFFTMYLLAKIFDSILVVAYF